MWNKIKPFFNFNKSDRIIVVLIIIAIIIGLCYPLFLKKYFVAQPNTVDSSKIKLLLTNITEIDSNGNQRFYTQNDDTFSTKQKMIEELSSPQELFNFDPNTATDDELHRLGFPKKSITSIRHYQAKNGHFYKKEALQKVFGVTEQLYQQLEPYIQIVPPTSTASKFPVYEKKKLTIVEINSADTSQFIDLPFIGHKLANRIVKYRTQLGGFVSVQQLTEVWGLQDSVLQKIKNRLTVNANLITPINIDTASAATLAKHPYIKWTLAPAIVNYRKQHGNFKTINDLKNVKVIDEAKFEKLKPYLKVN